MRSMLGKGAIQWAPYLVHLFIDSSADSIEYEAKQMIGARLITLQVDLPEDATSIDNASEDNMKKLVDIAKGYMTSARGSNKMSRILFILNYKDVNND